MGLHLASNVMPNSALLTDAFSSLRFACGAAKRGRSASLMRAIALLALVLGLAIPALGISADLQSEVLAQLKRDGSDVSKNHRFVFFFYLPTDVRAKRIAQELKKHGLSTRIRPGAKGSSWLCLASGTYIPSTPKLRELGDLFLALAKKYGGEFDGWEAEIVR